MRLPFLLSDAHLEELFAPAFASAPPPAPRPERSPLLKIRMMIHFASSVRPFAPEHDRTSSGYTRHVKTLLRQGMIERPSKRDRSEHPGWSYRLTERGRAYVEALRRVGLPEMVSTKTETVWRIP